MFEMKTTIFHWELLEVPKIGLRACKPGFGNCVVALSSPIETEPRFNQKIDQSHPASWNLQWQWSDFFTGKKSTYVANFHIWHFYYDLNFRYINTKYCSKPLYWTSMIYDKEMISVEHFKRWISYDMISKFMKDISCVRFEFVKRRQYRNNPPPRSTLGRAFSDRPEQFENSMRLRRECHRSDENIQILTSTTYSWYLL